MAPRGQQQARQREADTGADDEALLVQAMAATESEIFNEAMSLSDDENDGDTSAEGMEDIEGNPVDDAGNEVEDEGDEDDGAENDDESDNLDDEARNRQERQAGQDERGNQATDRRGDQQERPGARPSWRDTAPDPRDLLITDLQARLGRLESRPAAGQTEQRETAATDLPDPVLDPQGFRDGMRQQLLNESRQATQTAILESNFRATEAAYDREGRRDEFEYAAGELNQMSIAARSDQRLAQVVRGIVTAPDPGYALMQWAEKNLDLQGFRAESQENRLEQAARLLGVDVADLEGFAPQQEAERPQRARERNDGRQGQRGEQRQAPQRGQDGRQSNRGRRLPSLNSAGGSGREGGNSRNLDPNGFDGSEDSIFRYAMN